MAKGKKISEQPMVESLQGDELIPFAKDGANATVTPETIKEFTNDGLDDKYATNERVNDLLDGFAPKSWLAQTDQEVSRINDALISGLADKVDKVDGKGLSTNDFTDEDKAKLDRFELVLLTDDEIEDGLNQIAESEDYRSKLKERGYVVYHDVKFKIKDCGVDSNSFPWIVTEGAVITENEEGTLNDHTQENVVRSVYIWFDTILHYQPYNTPLSDELFTSEDRAKLDGIEAGAQVNPTKVSELTNDSKYQTETQVENRVAVLSQVWDAQLEGAFNNLDNSKVDKVEGKQLSTEDFTTLLKQKLEGLTNYDDATLTAELNALKSRLDTLVGSGDVTAVIDTFQEIEAFLQGVTNTQTLTGLLQEMKSEIVQLCADTYLPKQNGASFKLSGDGTFALMRFGNEEVAKAAANYIECYQGVSGFFNFKAGKYIVNGGTSSQFLKADGSVDGTAYLPTSGGTLASESFGPLTIKRNNATDGAAICFRGSDSIYGYIGFNVANKDKGLIRWQSDTSNNYRIWDSGNDGSGSGLDADLLDGKQPADLNVGSADKLTTKQLTNEDLNNIKDVNLNVYTSSNSNTCINKPNGVLAFTLQCQGYDSTFITQTLISINGEVFKRIYRTNTWTPWQQLATTDGAVAKLTNKQLTTEDLNSIKTIDFGSYWGSDANTCANKPINANAFVLTVSGKDVNNITQTFMRIDNGYTYKRVNRNGTWSAWVRLATADDPAPKLTTKQLTNADLDTIKDVNFSSYYANSGNTCTNKPTDINGFSLTVFKSTDNTYIQIINTSLYSYKRGFDGTGVWTPWKKMLTEDDVTKIQSVASVPSTPSANTLYVIPE